jgi:hypothetical protein
MTTSSTSRNDERIESSALQLLDGCIASHRAGELEEWELQLVRRRLLQSEMEPSVPLSPDKYTLQEKWAPDSSFDNRALEFAARHFEAYGASHMQFGKPWTGIQLAEVIRACIPSAEQPRHICGVRGWNPDLDGPCPACTPSHGQPMLDECGQCGRQVVHKNYTPERTSSPDSEGREE